jgi:hypothetical protein
VNITRIWGAVVGALVSAVLGMGGHASAQPAELVTRNCMPDQEDYLRATLQDASWDLAKVGADLQVLINGGSSSTFEYWFGNQDPDVIARVTNRFLEIRDVIDRAQYDCGCNLRQEDIDNGSTPENTMAWSSINAEYLVHLCPPFFREDQDEFGGGVLIHEFSHFAGTQDYVTACIGYPASPATTSAEVARDLAVHYPEDASNNADNYRLYAIDWDPARPTSWTCDEILQSSSAQPVAGDRVLRRQCARHLHGVA